MSRRRISPDNPVRRRLFEPDDLTDQARVDNFANCLQESIAREKEDKMRKYNFDFEHEVALPGTWCWYKPDGANDWIGINTDTKLNDDDDAKEEDSFLPMKAENEATPISNKEEAVPLLRKRRNDLEHAVSDTGVRRRISFD